MLLSCECKMARGMHCALHPTMPLMEPHRSAVTSILSTIHFCKACMAIQEGTQKTGRNSPLTILGTKKDTPIRGLQDPALELGTGSQVAHKWARWLHNPCRLGGRKRFRAGGSIKGGPKVGKVATQPLPPGGSPPLWSGGQNHKWPTSGQGEYITAAAWGCPALQSGGRISGGPQVGKVAT